MSAPGAKADLWIAGTGLLSPEGVTAEIALPAGAARTSFPALRCPDRLTTETIPAARLRRLGRAQKLALVAAERAAREAGSRGAGEDARRAVLVGTGLGEMGQTAAFLENLVRKHEAEPLPARFVNSVHNALASQIAILLGCTGENHTFTHGFASFELALWQATVALRAGRARTALVCGADETSPYLSAAGLAFGWWGGSDAASGDGAGRPSDRPLPGEGAGAVLLTRGEDMTTDGLARIKAVRVLQRGNGSGAVDPESEVEFIRDVAGKGGVAISDIDALIVGSNGAADQVAAYRAVTVALGSAAGRTLITATYKDRCGDFCTAAALGLVMAARSVRAGRLGDGLLRSGADDGAAGRFANVVLYHLCPTGEHTAILVGR